MIDPPSHRLNLKLISGIYFAKLGLQISRIICAKSRESLRYSNDAGVSVTSQRRLVINNSYVSNLRSNSPFGRISRYFLCRRVASPRVALRGTRERGNRMRNRERHAWNTVVVCAIAGKFGCFVRVLETTRTEVKARPSAWRHIRRRRIRRHVAWLPYVRLKQRRDKTQFSQWTEFLSFVGVDTTDHGSQIYDYKRSDDLARQRGGGRGIDGVSRHERVMKPVTRKSTSRGDYRIIGFFPTSPAPRMS